MVGRLKNAAGGNGNPIVVIADVKWYVKLHRLPNVITKLSIGPSFRIGDMHYGRCNANSIDTSNGDKYPNNFTHKGYSRFTIHDSQIRNKGTENLRSTQENCKIFRSNLLESSKITQELLIIH